MCLWCIIASLTLCHFLPLELRRRRGHDACAGDKTGAFANYRCQLPPRVPVLTLMIKHLRTGIRMLSKALLILKQLHRFNVKTGVKTRTDREIVPITDRTVVGRWRMVRYGKPSRRGRAAQSMLRTACALLLGRPGSRSGENKVANLCSFFFF